MKCGSLHLGGPCSNPADAGGSVPDPSFGPWLFAVRQRRQASGPQVAGLGKPQTNGSVSAAAHRSGSPIAKDGLSKEAEGSAAGWVTPTKIARRRSSSGEMAVVDLGSVSKLSGRKKELLSPGLKGVPVLSDRASLKAAGKEHLAGEKEGSREFILNNSVESKNPFSSLGLDPVVEGLSNNRDAFSGPLKRARPEVSVAPRSSAKLKNRKDKCKAPLLKKGGNNTISPGRLDHSPCHQDGDQTLVTSFCDRGAGPTLEALAGANVGLGSGPLPPLQSSQFAVSVLNSEGPLAGPVEMTIEGSLVKQGVADNIMIEDQEVVPISPSL